MCLLDSVRHGAFTRVLLGEMKRPGLSADRLLRNVRGEVVRLAKSVGHEQVPAIYDQTVGDFYFTRGTGPVVPTESKPTTAEAPDFERQAWEATLAAQSPAAVQAFLSEYPNGRYKVLAKIELARLADASPVGSPEGAKGAVPADANPGQKYRGLLQTLPCPQDQGAYGQFRDYGYWGGGGWCGQTGKAGYWVWVAPNWYIWERQQ